MTDTEFDDTSVDSERFNDDNSSDRSRNISVDLYDSDGEPLPGSVAPYERAVDGYRLEPTWQPSPTPSDADDADRRANDTRPQTTLVPKRLDNTDWYKSFH